MIEIPQWVDFFCFTAKLKFVERYKPKKRKKKTPTDKAKKECGGCRLFDDNSNTLFRGDTTGAHSNQLALMSMFVAEKFKLLVDVLRIGKLCVVHDLVEVITDDTPANEVHKKPHLKKQKHLKELLALETIYQMAPKSIKEELRGLILDYMYGNSPEAIFVKAMDKTESSLHVIENSTKKMVGDGLFPIYGREEILKAIDMFPQLRPYFEEINKRARCEVKKHGCRWKKKYDL